MFKLILLSLIAYSLQANLINKNNQVLKRTLKITQPQNIEFNFTNERFNRNECNPTIQVFDSNNETLIYDKHDGQKISESFYLPVGVGSYFVEIYDKTQNCWKKEFNFEIKMHDGNFEQEPNNIFSNALELKEGITYTGYLQNDNIVDKQDLYQISLANRATVSLTFKHVNLNTRDMYSVEILNADNKEVFKQISSLETSGFTHDISLDKGIYYISIKAYVSSKIIRNKPYSLSYSSKE